jgi:hypothetical protein
MTFRAVRMHGDDVERRELVLRVARDARRWTCGPARTVGPVARVASSFDVLVRTTLLVRVTGRAGRRLGEEGARVGLVAAGTRLVALGCRGLLLRVAARTGERDRGLVRRGAVTGRAGAVALVGGDELRLAGVTRHAQPCPRRWCEIVLLVTAHARSTPPMTRRVGRGDGLVAARAGDDLRSWAGWMRLVARDAGALAPVSDPDVRMATAARLRRALRGVWRVTGQARRVRGGASGEKNLLGLVAAQTGNRTPRDELVRLVAADTVTVGGWLRSLLLGVTGCARGEGGGCRIVAAVAIEAAARPHMFGVRGRALGVAGRAAPRHDRWSAMDLMALRTLGRCVHLHGRERPLGRGVARDARRRFLLRSKRMTREASGLALRIPGVWARDLLRVTLCAWRDSRVLETFALEIVTSTARDLSRIDVRQMTEARAVLGPRGRNHGRRHVRRARIPEYQPYRDRGHDERDAEGDCPGQGLACHVPPA